MDDDRWDLFAAAALAGQLANSSATPHAPWANKKVAAYADRAATLADAMMAERQKRRDLRANRKG